tara:strand:- start:340 stop:702 length:363 start_codon:yes stop_codon:yes gene_type:complete
MYSAEELKELEQICVEIAPYDVGLSVCVDPNLKKKVLGMVCGVESETNIYMIFPEYKPKTRYIVHELMHVLDELNKFINDELKLEARAYLVENLFVKTNMILKKLKQDKLDAVLDGLGEE